MITVLLALSGACIGISTAYYIVASVAAIRLAIRAASPAPPLPKIVPRVAVLKPLHGRDESLLDNLASFLELDYPRTEYYFAVSSYEDPAAEAPVALRAQYHLANITLIVGEEPNCANRKVAKLIRMAERSERSEIFVLSDADVSVDRDHLRHIIGELAADDKTGIVTCLYRARPRSSLASRMEALAVNTDFTPMVMVSAEFEPLRYALGATIAIKRAALDAIGGFRALKDVLADDYFLGRAAADHGYDVKLSSSFVTTTCEEHRFSEFWKHQLRWARTYRTTRPLSLATILIHGPFWGLVLLIASRLNPFAIAAFAVLIAARLAMAALITDKVLGMPELRRDLWLVPFKDLVMTAIYFTSLLGNEILWGGRRLEILSDGTMREVSG